MASSEGIQGVCVCIQVQMLKLCTWRDRGRWTPLELKEGQCLFSLGFYTVIHNLWVTGKAQSLCADWTPVSVSIGWLNLRHSMNRQLSGVSKNCIYFCVPFSSLVCKKKPIVLIATHTSFYFLFTCVGSRMNYSELPNCSVNMPQAKQWLQTCPEGLYCGLYLTVLGAGGVFLRAVSPALGAEPPGCGQTPPQSQSILLKAE